MVTKTGTLKRIVLKCDLGGEYIAKKASTTNSSSRRTGCTYEIVCSKKKEVWGVRKVEGGHNHSVSLDLSGHVPIPQRSNFFAIPCVYPYFEQFLVVQC